MIGLLTVAIVVAAVGWLAWHRERKRPKEKEANGITRFRRRVLAAHASAFKLHQEILVAIEDAIVVERKRSDRYAIAIDVLMYQAFKSDATVSLLAQHGLLEDTATIARRLMELAIQAMYMAADEDKTKQEERASRYLSHMWRNMDEKGRLKMPAEIQQRWEDISKEVGDSLKPGATRWGPTWKDMFALVGASEMYEDDYSYLSSMAHGSPDDLILFFSLARQQIHRHEHAWVLLWYATKYFLIVAIQWNNAFQVLTDPQMKTLIDRAGNWKRPTQ